MSARFAVMLMLLRDTHNLQMLCLQPVRNVGGFIGQ